MDTKTLPVPMRAQLSETASVHEVSQEDLVKHLLELGFEKMAAQGYPVPPLRDERGAHEILATPPSFLRMLLRMGFIVQEVLDHRFGRKELEAIAGFGAGKESFRQ